jgi:D-inositol-3-phosphate glycosyltransferase
MAEPRALIVSAYALPHLGGVEVVVAQQASTLAALGQSVTVLTSRLGARDVAARERAGGYDIVRVPAWNKLEERSGVPLPIWSPAALWPLAALVRGSDAIYVHDVYHPQSFVAAALARMLRRPLFVTQHVAIVDHDKAVVKLVQRLLYGSAGRLLWRWALTITVYNPIVEAFITGHGVPPGKVRLTYNGIDTAQFRPGDPVSARATRERYGLPTERPIVLFAGRLVPKKGFGRLVAARGPEYHIVLAGPGPIPADVPAGVTFLGPVSRTDLLALYQASDIFALPAVSEMLTLAMQEAMSCGLPVVTTDDSAYARYDLDPAGVALVPPDPPTLRSTFLAILGDPDRKRYMSVYSRQLAEDRFDWHHNVVPDLARQP